MNGKVAIIGVGWVGFSPSSSAYSYKEMMYEAAVRAYNDASVDPRRDIESFVTVAEDFHEGTSIFDEYVPDQIGAALKPVQTICGDGIHGLATGFMLVKTGQYDIVAVEAHSKASNLLTHNEVTAYAQDPVINRPLGLNTHFIAGLEMNRFLHVSGNTRAGCAAVVVKNRTNALLNPNAPFGVDISMQDVLNGPPLSWPLGRRETAPHADGGIVMVLASDRVAKQFSNQPIWIKGIGWANGAASLESRDWDNASYLRQAAKMAYNQTGINNPLQVIDFAELEDSYAYKELQALETLGFCRVGEASNLTMDGYTSSYGALPVNVSGGSLGCGNLLDASGLARVLEVVIQLRGEAGSRQLEDVRCGMAQSWRGLPTTSVAVAILSNEGEENG
jgi:acetyl-CoA C-acetyltransferase